MYREKSEGKSKIGRKQTLKTDRIYNKGKRHKNRLGQMLLKYKGKAGSYMMRRQGKNEKNRNQKKRQAEYK